jgi:hypothetical protein
MIFTGDFQGCREDRQEYREKTSLDRGYKNRQHPRKDIESEWLIKPVASIELSESP